MSFELVDKVLDSGITDPTGIRVLVAIAKVINSTTRCWRISNSELARLSRTSPNSLSKSLRKYEEEGVLIVKREKDQRRKNMNLANVYEINEKVLDQLYPSATLKDRGTLKNEDTLKNEVTSNLKVGTLKNEGRGTLKNEGRGTLKNEGHISNDKEDISKDKEFIDKNSAQEGDLFSQSDFSTGNNSENGTTPTQNPDIPAKNEGTPKPEKPTRKKKATPFPWGDEFPDELQDLKTNPKYATLLIEDEYERFLNYYMSHGKTRVDWRRAFISWLLNAKDFQKDRVLTKAQQKPKKKPQKENFNEPGRWDGFVGEDGTMI